MELPSRVMERGRRNVPLNTPSVVSEVSLGRSSHQFNGVKPLRMISSHDSTSFRLSAPQPHRMEVNSGKSSHYSHSGAFTLKDDTGTPVECSITKQKRLQLGQVYSSAHSLRITLQLQ